MYLVFAEYWNTFNITPYLRVLQLEDGWYYKITVQVILVSDTPQFISNLFKKIYVFKKLSTIALFCKSVAEKKIDSSILVTPALSTTMHYPMD